VNGRHLVRGRTSVVWLVDANASLSSLMPDISTKRRAWCVVCGQQMYRVQSEDKTGRFTCLNGECTEFSIDKTEDQN
jgi:hypothetical protein